MLQPFILNQLQKVKGTKFIKDLHITYTEVTTLFTTKQKHPFVWAAAHIS